MFSACAAGHSHAIQRVRGHSENGRWGQAMQVPGLAALSAGGIARTGTSSGLRAEELTAFLNRDELIAMWPTLFVPRGVRQAWEDEHDLTAAPDARAPGPA